MKTFTYMGNKKFLYEIEYKTIENGLYIHRPFEIVRASKEPLYDFKGWQVSAKVGKSVTAGVGPLRTLALARAYARDLTEIIPNIADAPLDWKPTREEMDAYHENARKYR